MATIGRHATFNGICSETFHKILSENGIKARGTISGGSDSYTREMFCLPNDVPLPLSYYTIGFPVAVDVKTVNSAFRIALGKDMAHHTVCPEAANGIRDEYSFFVYVSSNLKASLGESYIRDEKTKENLLMVYNASQPENNTGGDMALPQRLCALVLLYSFILFKADARALGFRPTFSWRLEDINKSLKKNCKRTASQIVRKAQRSLLEKAYATYQLNLEQPKDSTDVVIPREHAISSSSKSAKRPLDLKDNGLQDDDISPRSVNSAPGTPLFVNDNQDGFFMESYDPFAEANPFNDDENRSL
ncbi:hypothetical protein M9435_000429 [Picochlorum sp. BPE23]|nr:hypothetical protein M9435_000429 [Picochlorum sp. BPE23]